jgi:hypothetical protein
MYRQLQLVLLCALALSYGESARADDSRPTTGLGADATPDWLDAPARDAKREWYGWQTLVGDGVALVAFGVAAVAPDESGLATTFAFTGLGSYTLAAPISHAAHGRWGAAFGSLGLRSVPFLASVAYAGCWQPFGGEGSSAGCSALEVLAVVSFVTPIILDAAVLAYDDAPATHEPRTQLAPWLTRESGGVLVARSF